MIDSPSIKVDCAQPSLTLVEESPYSTKNKSMVLKQQLHKLLKKRALTASELSRKSGVSRQVLSLWMSGGQPRRIEQIKKVADVLNVSIEELCFGELKIAQPSASTDRRTSLGEISADEWIGGFFEVKFRRIKQPKG